MAANGKILARSSGGILATSCGGGGGGDNDPLPPGTCDACSPGITQPREKYNVTISGVPDICGMAAFNGVWTVSWVQGCLWEYPINEYDTVFLALSAPWAVTVNQNVSGGSGAQFYAFEELVPGTCYPDEVLWEPGDCYGASGCYGLCTDFYFNATCVVTLP
jgi:hypothetical protein